jgi:hypothetical protein
MPRYWVKLGPHPKGLEKLLDVPLPKNYQEAANELENLSNGLADNLQNMVFKTTDESELKQVVKQAIAIVRKHLGQDMDLYEYGLGINTQPECPKCGHLGRFSDKYCHHCGSELMPSQEIELSEFVEGGK